MGKPKIAKSMRWPLPIGTKVWFETGLKGSTPYHIRGHVDGCMVVRRWDFNKSCWRYDVKGHFEFDLWLRKDRLRIQYPTKKSKKKR